MNSFLLAIISTGRSNNVEFMQELCKPFICSWYVNYNEGIEYTKAGANMVTECGFNICHARNAAIADAKNANIPCIQISDDLKSIKEISFDENTKRIKKFVSVEYVCNLLISKLKEHNAYYGGVAVSANPLNYSGIDTDSDKLVVNDFICMMPGPYIFDESVALKEDYDMCIHQLVDRHPIIRLNNILCDFPHRNNKGGANTYRNDLTEAAATRAIMKKWPKYVLPHKTRPGQISLNYKAIKAFLNGIEPSTLF
jgi:hypothetical protein